MATAPGLQQMPDHGDSIQYEHEDLDPHRTASVSAQLATWHAGRGNRSFLSAMIPRWRKLTVEEQKITKNPVKLLMMVNLRGWLMFFSGWFAWTCDGYDFFAVSLTVGRLAKQFDTDTQVGMPHHTHALPLDLESSRLKWADVCSTSPPPSR